MQRETFPVPPLGCNCSILYDETSSEAVVVDPGGDLVRIEAFLLQRSLKLKAILVTHAHIDHIAGARSLSQIFGAPVLYNQADLPLVSMMDVQAGWLGVATPEVAPPDADLAEGTRVQLGAETGTVLHTPGHTPGSVSLHFPESRLLLAGDTLFRRSIGRTDLPGGDTGTILRSIRERLLPLPGDTLVIAGHGDTTTVAEERDANPFLQFQ